MTMQARIIDYNYLFESGTAVSDTSSDVEFPVSNMTSYFRSKCWRSTGYFEIDATNNKIDFKESGGGSELHATLTTGSYTPTTLAAEIALEMHAVGVATYTVTFSATTGKWTIATSGAYLSILWATGTNTAVSVGALIGFDITADSTGALTYTGASIALHSYEAVTIDLGATDAIDSCAVFFDSMAGLKLTTSAVMHLQANATNVWTAPAVDVTISISNQFEVASYYFTTDQNYRYWRLKITDPKNPYLYVELGKIVLGKATMLGRLPSYGFKWTREDRSAITQTPYGHQYADVYPQLSHIELNHSAMSYADLTTVDSIYKRVGRVVPIVVSIDPLADTFNKDHFAIYGKFAADPQITQKIAGFFDWPIKIVESI